MQDIPFTLRHEGRFIYGFLSAPHGSGTSCDLPTHFHVMERRRDGVYYAGQLMLNPHIGWWLPDSKYERYAEELGERVAAWFQ